MSVRGDRTVVYREHDDYEEAPKRTYTTIKRYQVPESVRSALRADDEVKEDKVIIRRERRSSSPASPPPPPKDDVQWRVTERLREPSRDDVDIRVTRERSREPSRDDLDYRVTDRVRERSTRSSPPRRDIRYRVIERDNDFDRLSHSAPRSEYRVVERDTDVIRAPSPPSPARTTREFRFERERDFSPPERRPDTIERPYDLEKYSKSTEYFAQPQPIIIRESQPQPQPIIIREERRDPIIIREERREPQYEFVERDEVKEDRSLVKREEPPPPATVSAPSQAPEPEQKPEEDYFYERRVREIDRSRERRQDVRPRDSASNYGSEDSYEYIRKERTYDGDRRDRSRSGSHSPHHRRHLAEGVIAGIGAAEILRHHRKSEGRPVGGRLRDGVAGAAVGALGAEAVSRVRTARSKSRSRRSRSRSRSSSYEDRRDRSSGHRKHRSRSRDKSLSRAQQLGGWAAVAAVGALAGYALKNRGGNKETIIVNDRPHRSRSRRRRRASADSYYTDSRLSEGGRTHDPDHRNRRIAQAGLASAAAAGAWDRFRSRSRTGRSSSRPGRSRSRSRLRQGVPIAAAGLGGAALAGLYENSKANKERKKQAIIDEELRRGRGRGSRSRSRSIPARYPSTDRSMDDRGLVAYGNEPIYSGPDRGYYSDDEPGMYRRRHTGGSSQGSSPDTRRRSHSRARHLGEAGAAAGAAAVAAHEMGKRRERSRHRDVDRGRYDDDASYGDPYGRDAGSVYSPPPGGHPAGYLPPEQSHPAYGQQEAYPASNYFPPPPTGEYAPQPSQPYPPQPNPYGEQHNPYPAYNPADYAQGGPPQPLPPQQQQQQYPQNYGAYPEGNARGPEPHPGEGYGGGHGYAEPGGAPHESGRGRDPENVSAPREAHTAKPDSPGADGISTPRPPRSRSQSRVRFDLDQNTTHSAEDPRTQGSDRATEERYTDSETNDDTKHRHRRRRDHSDRHGRRRPSSQLMNDVYEREPSESDSEGTVEELPPRFDAQGNKLSQGDPLVQAINGFLGPSALADLFGALGGHSSDDHNEGRSGRRKHRR